MSWMRPWVISGRVKLAVRSLLRTGHISSILTMVVNLSSSELLPLLPYSEKKKSDSEECNGSQRDRSEPEKESGYIHACCPIRWQVATIGMLVFVLKIAVQTNFSTAIVCMVNSTRENGTSTGEFVWTKTEQTYMLSAVFYGLLISGLPGGWLASAYGGKRVIQFALVTNAIAALIFPVSARTWKYFVYIIRFLQGLTVGIVTPAIKAMLGQWSPRSETSKLTGLTFSGLRFGAFITFLASGELCQYGFDSGWGSIFYITGISTLVCSLLWQVIAADRPENHPRISQEERDFIESTAARYKQTDATPWFEMLTSKPAWAVLIGDIFYMLVISVMVTDLPLYMHEVTDLSIGEIGLLTALPYIGQGVAGVLAGQIVDYIRGKDWFSLLTIRRAVQAIAFLGAMCCFIVVGHARNIILMEAMLILTMFFLGLSTAGVMVSNLDIAPRFSGELEGLASTISTIGSMTGTYLVGYLTPNGTEEEWRLVFYVLGLSCFLGAVIYGVLIESDIQPWAKESE